MQTTAVIRLLVSRAIAAVTSCMEASVVPCFGDVIAL